jgi:hypothetical protein
MMTLCDRASRSVSPWWAVLFITFTRVILARIAVFGAGPHTNRTPRPRCRGVFKRVGRPSRRNVHDDTRDVVRLQQQRLAICLTQPEVAALERRGLKEARGTFLAPRARSLVMASFPSEHPKIPHSRGLQVRDRMQLKNREHLPQE